MPSFLRAALILSALGLAACDEVAVANDPVARAQLRASNSCVSAVSKETGVSGVAMNTTIPVIELNRYIVDVPGGPYWTCITSNEGQAISIVQNRRG